ncbi:MAG: MBL fold metallo-hydrolase [Fidelibacterota bacterium]
MIPTVITTVVGPFQENCYLLGFDDREQSALIVDPGAESERIAQELDSRGWLPKAILNTHGHLDHIGAVANLQDRYGIPFYLQGEERPVLESYPDTCRMFGLTPSQPPTVDRWLNSDDRIRFPFGEIRVLFTPGHTPGSCLFLIGNLGFTGDTVFAGSVGRTDLPGGNYETLQASLVRILHALPDETALYPGHGPQTTLKDEKRQNPFLRPLVLQ